MLSKVVSSREIVLCVLKVEKRCNSPESSQNLKWYTDNLVDLKKFCKTNIEYIILIAKIGTDVNEPRKRLHV